MGYIDEVCGYEGQEPPQKPRNYNQWIPVGEQLPEEGEWVLWFNGSWSCPIAVAKRDGKLLDWGGDFCLTLHGFTHWMPLPEPPEVK